MPILLSLALFFAPIGAIHGASPDRLVVCDDVSDPWTLDPHKEFSEKNYTLLQQIYEGLVRFDPEAKIEPVLALSWERVDLLRMRFHLRDKVRFHNGEPFNAEAVRYSIERLLDPRTKHPGLPFISTIDRAEVIDSLTADIVTKIPDGLLLNRLAWNVPIVPPGYLREVGDEEFARRPAGTGPFQFAVWEKGKEIVLKANTNYWLEGHPKLRELVFRFIPEDDKLPALFDGSVDLVTNIPGTKTLEVQANPVSQVVKGRTFFTAFAGLNASTAPFSDVRVRKAVNLAIDREALIRYDLLGNGMPIATLSMPGEAGHDPSLRPYPYDPRRAKALLREAGYPNGFTVEAGGNINAARAAKIIVADLARIGIKVKYKLSSDSELLEDFKNHSYQMIFGGVPDPMAHSYMIQSMVLYSKSPYSIGKNPEYDAMLEKMVSTIDDEQRESAARALDRHIYDQALGVFTYQRIQTHAARKGLKWTPHLTGTYYFFQAHYEKKQSKAQSR